MRSFGALLGRNKSLGDRHGGIPHAQHGAVAERRLRLRQALQAEHLSQLQLHGTVERLRNNAQPIEGVFLQQGQPRR